MAFVSFMIAAIGWECEQATARNQFLMAVGIMYFVWSAGCIYMEGMEIIMDRTWLPVFIDATFFIFAFAGACAAILDEEAVNCGYTNTKAAAMCMFICMLCIFGSLLYSINDMFSTGSGPKRAGQGAGVKRSMRNLRKNFEHKSDPKVKRGSTKKTKKKKPSVNKSLPPGWSEHQSEGQTYYFHDETGKSQWTRPT